MIFSTLHKIGVPYLVIKFKVTSPLLADVVSYRYQIIIDYDARFQRLGFKPEREIERYQGVYMYRNLSPREVAVFRNYGYEPTYKSQDGTGWEIGGTIKRRYHRNSRLYREGLLSG